jgi:hypothetical protein
MRVRMRTHQDGGAERLFTATCLPEATPGPSQRSLPRGCQHASSLRSAACRLVSALSLGLAGLALLVAAPFSGPMPSPEEEGIRR